MLVEVTDLLGEDGRGKVVRRILADLKHALLAVIFGALHIEDVRWVAAVLHEILSLGLILREFVEEHTCGRLIYEVLDQ